MKSNIEIEYYEGGNDVLLILTGLGGSTKGYQNEYKTIAENAVSKHNATVFVATTPPGSWEHPKENICYVMNYINSHMDNKGFTSFNINAMGYSAGATFLAWYAYELPNIKRVIAINPVLMINIHRMVDGINNFEGESIKVIIGEKDPSITLAPMLDKIKSERFERLTILNADHNFMDMLEDFIDLPEKFLY